MSYGEFRKSFIKNKFKRDSNRLSKNELDNKKRESNETLLNNTDNIYKTGDYYIYNSNIVKSPEIQNKHDN